MIIEHCLELESIIPSLLITRTNEYLASLDSILAVETFIVTFNVKVYTEILKLSENSTYYYSENENYLQSLNKDIKA